MTEAGQPGRDYVTGIVLAAGSATRMGRPKTTLPLNGRPLLQHVIDNVRDSRLADCVVVLRADDDEAVRIVRGAGDGFTAVVNEDADAGQGSSLRAGLRAVPAACTAVAILLADQPGVDAAAIDRVLDHAARSDRPIARPVHVHGAAREPGHPVVATRSTFAALESIGGDEGARAVLRAHPEWLDEIAVDGPAPPDVDTPEDYARLTTG